VKLLRATFPNIFTVGKAMKIGFDATANGGRVHTVERAKRCLASFKEKGTPYAHPD
jgi:hypothetical protein